MLLRVYFISLVLCVNIVFCYKYIQEHDGNLKNNHGTSKKEDTKGRGLHQSRNRRRPDPRESEHNAQIDVASFIQAPDESMENGNSFQEFESNRESGDYANSEYLDNMLQQDVDSSRNFDNVDVDRGQNKKDGAAENMYTLLVTPAGQVKKNEKVARSEAKDKTPQHLRHFPERKCIFKNMRIPFFSRKSNGTSTKKNRKRRLLGFHRTKTTARSKPAEVVTRIVGKDTTQAYHKLKRSYFERLCPKCKRKYDGERVNVDVDYNSVVHNSRQYYRSRV